MKTESQQHDDNILANHPTNQNLGHILGQCVSHLNQWICARLPCAQMASKLSSRVPVSGHSASLTPKNYTRTPKFGMPGIHRTPKNE